MMPRLDMTRTPTDMITLTVTLSPDEAEAVAAQLAAALGLRLTQGAPVGEAPTYTRQGIPTADPSTYALEYYPELPQDQTCLTPEQIAAIPDAPPTPPGAPIFHIRRFQQDLVLCRSLPLTTLHWPPGHSWVSLAHWDRATCAPCRTIAAGLLLRERRRGMRRLGTKPRWIALEWQPRDLWVGVSWAWKDVAYGTAWGLVRWELHVYVCLVPCLPIHLILAYPQPRKDSRYAHDRPHRLCRCPGDRERSQEPGGRARRDDEPYTASTHQLAPRWPLDAVPPSLRPAPRAIP